jgi:hypothetical protein
MRPRFTPKRTQNYVITHPKRLKNQPTILMEQQLARARALKEPIDSNPIITNEESHERRRIKIDLSAYEE